MHEDIINISKSIDNMIKNRIQEQNEKVFEFISEFIENQEMDISEDTFNVLRKLENKIHLHLTGERLYSEKEFN